VQLFHIRYRNSQGTLMRILNAVSRRGLELTSVHAEYAGHDHVVTMMLHVSPKQIGQLSREWHSIVDVTHVHAIPALSPSETPLWTAHPPVSVTEPSARGAMA
jgi:acetolactate synthase small subunit